VSDDPYALLGVQRGATLDELAAARRRLAMQRHPDVGGDAGAMQRLNLAYDRAVREFGTVEPVQPVRAPRGVQYDCPSFTMDVLPAEAFEALLVVAAWMGEVLVDDPPYLVETFLRDPAPCWCRLDLVPDAGATTVSLTVAGIEGDPSPDVEAVRDEWVANLNRLGDLPS
jgi:hypothetical protein